MVPDFRIAAVRSFDRGSVTRDPVALVDFHWPLEDK
jgi:hypothetical protein